MNWEIASHLAWVAHFTWTMCFCCRSVVFIARGTRANRVVNRVFFEVRPFVPVLLVVRYVSEAVLNGADMVGWRIVFLALDVVVWLIARREKDDDDRWKKRLKAASDKVSDLGHRLVVVPGGSS